MGCDELVDEPDLLRRSERAKPQASTRRRFTVLVGEIRRRPRPGLHAAPAPRGRQSLPRLQQRDPDSGKRAGLQLLRLQLDEDCNLTYTR